MAIFNSYFDITRGYPLFSRSAALLAHVGPLTQQALGIGHHRTWGLAAVLHVPICVKEARLTIEDGAEIWVARRFLRGS